MITLHKNEISRYFYLAMGCPQNIEEAVDYIMMSVDMDQTEPTDNYINYIKD